MAYERADGSIPTLKYASKKGECSAQKCSLVCTNFKFAKKFFGDFCAPARLSSACARNVGVVTNVRPPDLVDRFCLNRITAIAPP